MAIVTRRNFLQIVGLGALGLCLPMGCKRKIGQPTAPRIFSKNEVKMIPTENGYRVMLDHQEIGFTKDFFNWHIIFGDQDRSAPIGAYYCNNPTVYSIEGGIFTSVSTQGSSVDLINNEGKKWGIVDTQKGEVFDLQGKRLYLSDSYYYPIWQKPMGAIKNRLMGFIGPMQSQWGMREIEEKKH